MRPIWSKHDTNARESFYDWSTDNLVRRERERRPIGAFCGRRAGKDEHQVSSRRHRCDFVGVRAPVVGHAGVDAAATATACRGREGRLAACTRQIAVTWAHLQDEDTKSQPLGAAMPHTLHACAISIKARMHSKPEMPSLRSRKCTGSRRRHTGLHWRNRARNSMAATAGRCGRCCRNGLRDARQHPRQQ